MATTVTVHLVDGRTIDVSGLSAAQAVARLRAVGVRLADIKETVHKIGGNLDSLVRALPCEAAR